MSDEFRVSDLRATVEFDATLFRKLIDRGDIPPSDAIRACTSVRSGGDDTTD